MELNYTALYKTTHPLMSFFANLMKYLNLKNFSACLWSIFSFTDWWGVVAFSQFLTSLPTGTRSGSIYSGGGRKGPSAP